jgi:hypothetical protein
LKLQRLQNRVLRITGNFPRRIQVRELHKAFIIPYNYDNITKVYKHQAAVIQKNGYAIVHNIGQSDAGHKI